MTMVAEYPSDVAAADRRDRAESARSLITVSEEKRCPRCQSMIPPECVSARPKTDPAHVGAYVRTVLIYCPPCKAAFEADFETHNGIPVQVAPTRVVLNSPDLDKLRANRAMIRGDVVLPPPVQPPADLVDRIALTMEAEHELADEDARRAMARSIRRTEVSLERLRQTYALRYPDRPYTPEEAAGIDQGDADCDLATSRFQAHREQTPYIPDVERTIDPSTSQVEATDLRGVEDRLDLLENQDPERWDGLS